MEFDESIIEKYKNMVYRIAWQYTSDAELWKDLTQEGYLGLRKACNTFEESYGVKFSTHAYITISGKIRQYLNYSVDIVHVPINSEAKKVKIVDMEIGEGEGVSPSMVMQDIRDAMEHIDPEMAELIMLHYFYGHSKTELADIKRMNYQTLVAKMGRALQQLRLIMES